MAKLHVTEYKHPRQSDANDGIILAVEPAVTKQAITFTTSTASSAFNAETSCVRLCSDTDCYINFGTGSPTADADDEFLAAGVVEYKFVPLGQSYIVAVYDGTS